MGVAGKISQHLFRPSKWALGVDEPVRLPQGCEVGLEGSPVGKMLMIGEELQAIGGVRVDQHSQHAPAQQGRENFDGHEMSGREAIQRDPSGENPPPVTIMCTWG
jgi:hypothetical protein